MEEINYESIVQNTIAFLRTKKRLLFLTTSNRWRGEKDGEQPKSTRLAYHVADIVGKEKVDIIDIPELILYPCEGNISTARGNTCGVKEAILQDPEKNPSGQHRCWASMNNPDDELWKVSKSVLQSDCVVFFGSVRWGQMNAHYQRLIERLTWLENRHSTLGEDNLLKDIDAGIIIFGHNWNGEQVLETQKEVLSYFGFHVVDALCWNWQYTTPDDESHASYQSATAAFEKTFLK